MSLLYLWRRENIVEEIASASDLITILFVKYEKLQYGHTCLIFFKGSLDIENAKLTFKLLGEKVL